MAPRSAEAIEAAVAATGLLDPPPPGTCGNSGDVSARPGPFGNSGDESARPGRFGNSGDVRSAGPLLVLCSAGRDSACLLDLAVRRRGAGGVRMLHVDHGFRAESGAEAEHVRAVASALGVEVVVRRVGTPPESGNVHAWARGERARIADQVAREVGATAIATAHTRTDLVETALFRFATQPGRRALLAMRPLEPWSVGNPRDKSARLGPSGNAGDESARLGPSGNASDESARLGPSGNAGDGRGIVLVRPLLGIGRDETLAYCVERGLVWKDDPSNADRKYARARLRHSVTPVLRGLNPRFEEAAVQTLRELEDERGVLDALVAQVLTPGTATIEVAVLAELPRPLGRLVLRELCERSAGRPVARAAARLDEILGRALADRAPFALDVGDGVRVSVRQGVLAAEASEGPAAPASS